MICGGYTCRTKALFVRLFKLFFRGNVSQGEINSLILGLVDRVGDLGLLGLRPRRARRLLTAGLTPQHRVLSIVVVSSSSWRCSWERSAGSHPIPVLRCLLPRGRLEILERHEPLRSRKRRRPILGSHRGGAGGTHSSKASSTSVAGRGPVQLVEAGFSGGLCSSDATSPEEKAEATGGRCRSNYNNTTSNARDTTTKRRP